MVQRDVYVRKPSLNKLECGQIQPMTYKNLLHRVEYFGLSGASMKALPEDELGKIDDDATNTHSLNLVQGMRV